MSKRSLQAVVLGAGGSVLLAFFGACAASQGDDGAGAAGGQAPATTSNTGGAGGDAGAGGDGAQGGGVSEGCDSDDDCNVDPIKTKCNLGTGECVGCLLDDPCEPGKYCDPQLWACIPGCTEDEDCEGGGVDLFCDTQSNNCVGCVESTDCPSGTICVNEQCIEGCDETQPCPVGESCCGSPNGKCHDLATDISACGSCGNACLDLFQADEVCINGQCGIGMCQGVYENCNSQVADGCEQNTLQEGACACMPNSTQPCYLGPLNTENVGACKAGTQTCNPDGLGWGACVGQVLPSYEICANGIDEDCDGLVDNNSDQDGDGFSACDGDCCDKAGPGCVDPALINPGAFEVPGNGVDDDCDPASSDAAPVDCSTMQKLKNVSAVDMAKAMDLCQFTIANPPISQKKWGVITAEQKLGSGANPSAANLVAMKDYMNAVLTDYGTQLPKKGVTMAGIATGRMRDQADPEFVPPNNGTVMNIANSCPVDYIAAHNNSLPASSGCSGNCPTGQTCNDSTNIKLTIRVPTNAKSFSYNLKFHSAEFPEYVCTLFNDFYLALLQTQAPGNPQDKNISFDSLGNPFSVNNGFFDACAPSGCHTCPAGLSQLANTGMQNGVGGGSVWLTTDAPIVPGETMVIEFMTFDVGDSAVDTNVLIDNFTWNLEEATLGTHE